MSKGAALALVVALAACSGSGPATPPDPVSSVTVVATYNGLPLVAMAVVESSGYDYATNTATGVLSSSFTDGNGHVTFTGLAPGAGYCFSFHTGYGGSPIYGVACQDPVTASTIYINTPQ